MIVAPIPVCTLRGAILMIIRAIGAMVVGQILAICVVFAIVPVVIILVVAIVDTDLNGGVLRQGGGEGHGWCDQCCCQDHGTDVAIDETHYWGLQIPRWTGSESRYQRVWTFGKALYVPYSTVSQMKLRSIIV